MKNHSFLPLLRRYQIPIIVTLLCIVLALVESSLPLPLYYMRDSIIGGEWHLFITSNFLHTNWNHLLLNCGGLWLIWFIFWDVTSIKWQWSFIVFPIMVNTVLLFFFSPSVDNYVGMSGALHGTIVAFGIADLSKNKWTSIALLAGVAIKLAYELHFGSSDWTKDLIEADVVEEAHLWGALVGALIGSVYYFIANTSKE